MGINCLLPFLKSCSSQVQLSDFSGQTAAVDVSCWLHKALVVSYQCHGTFQRYAYVTSRDFFQCADFEFENPDITLIGTWTFVPSTLTF